MGAASYIGRIGGLAVALGVGTAIITGQGVAYATPDAGSQDGGSQSSGSETGGQTKTNTGTATNDTGNAEDKNSGTSEADGRHRATATTSGSVRATTIVRRLSDAADATAKRVADAIHDAGDATNGVKASSPGTQRSGGSSSQTGRATKRTSAPGTADTDNASDTGNVVANEFVNKAPTIKQWLASPRAVAGRAGDTASTVSTQTSLWTPPRFLTGQGSDNAHRPHRRRSMRPTFWPPCSAMCSTRSPEIHRTHRRRTRHCPGCSWGQHVARSASTRSRPNRSSLLRIRSRMRR